MPFGGISLLSKEEFGGKRGVGYKTFTCVLNTDLLHQFPEHRCTRFDLNDVLEVRGRVVIVRYDC